MLDFWAYDEDGKTYHVQYYNIDMIISVGYIVNSKKDIVFRKTIKLIDIAGRIDGKLKGTNWKLEI